MSMEDVLTAFMGDPTPIRIVTTAGGAGVVGMVADVTDGIVEVVDGKSTQTFIDVAHVGMVEVTG